MLRETTSRGRCDLVCPSRTSERGREGYCVREGGGRREARQTLQGVSWGAYRESRFSFFSLPLSVEGTSLTTSLCYEDAVLAASYIYS